MRLRRWPAACTAASTRRAACAALSSGGRARERGALDRFEQEKVSFFAKVRSGFEEIHRHEPERMKRLDATQAPEQVFKDALSYLN